jgi:LysR family transcriptional regulator, regulator for metE and metH
MSLDTKHLRLLQAIVDEGGVSAAARKLHLTQPALSHQLRAAENDLRTRLFDRINKKMILTAAGRRLLDRSRPILQELDAAEKELRSTPATLPPLRISTECYTCYHWLPTRLQLFQEKFPHAEVQIVVEATHHPLPALLDGQLDIGIVANPVKHKPLEYHPLFEDELVVILPCDHPFAHNKYFRAEDFSDQHFLLYAISPKDSTVYKKVLNPAGVTPRKVTHVPLTEAILEMVRANLGIAVFARWAVAPLLASGELSAVRLTRWGIRRNWHAAVRRNHQRPPHVDAFVALLQKYPISQSFRASKPAQLRAATLLHKP